MFPMGWTSTDVEDGTVPLRKCMCLYTGRKVVKQGRVEQYLVLYEDYMLLYTMAYVLKEILLHFTNHLHGNMMLVKHMHQDIVKGRDWCKCIQNLFRYIHQCSHFHVMLSTSCSISPRYVSFSTTTLGASPYLETQSHCYQHISTCCSAKPFNTQFIIKSIICNWWTADSCVCLAVAI